MTDDDRSLAVARLIDARCDELEQALAKGESPQIESVLSDVPEEHRPELNLELLG